MSVRLWCRKDETYWEKCTDQAGHLDGKCYRSDFRLGGADGQRMREYHDTKADALSYERNTISDYERGIINPSLKAFKRTMQEACDHYKKVHLVPNGQYADEPYVDLFCKLFGPTTMLAAIDQDVCKKVFAELVERWQVQTVIRRWTTLIAIFRENKKWLRYNPAQGVIPKLMRKKSQKKKEIYFTDEQYFKLLDVVAKWPAPINQDLTDIIVIFRHTGFRLGDGENFKVEHVDFLTNTIHVPDQKNGESASIPLLPEVKTQVKAIMARKGITSGLLLNFSNITKRFRALVKAAGLYKPYPQNLTLHSLRHSFGTYIQKNYKDINVTQKLMRHKTIGMTQRYAHAAQDMVRAAGIAGSAVPSTEKSVDSPVKWAETGQDE